MSMARRIASARLALTLAASAAVLSRATPQLNTTTWSGHGLFHRQPLQAFPGTLFLTGED